jgi:acyl transferase domain-containing protein/thioester reductase-like protein/acyl carrier protein/SAM-dependent methyltransferase
MKAYTSVAYDDNRATVTVPSASVTDLQRALRAADVTAIQIGLRGAFHHPSYRDDARAVSDYCDKHPSILAFPKASALEHPTMYDSTVALDDGIALHTHALQAILVEQSRWIHTFKHARNIWIDNDVDSKIVSLGPERCIPPSMAAELRSKVIHRDHYKIRSDSQDQHQERRPDDIAIVGMSIKVAGADDAGEFWDLLCKAESQHQEVPEDRFKFESIWRNTDAKRKWFGNFVRHHDTFDHRFFKKSAREAAATDPQHRQMLQAAYQAVEQSGYFGFDKENADTNVGCFIGSCTGDYEHNVACYEPNAFTAVGNLRGFPAGKISHYFGWTGPSLCIDTACSSSLVAIHQACQAILTGDCSTALAGGTNIVTHPVVFQNLAAASFLSPTGQCKPFDAGADGYCRGEGVAAVYLKRMSSAIAQGDQIFGTISSTAVLQNQNCTPIFVPHAGSLSQLFTKVLDRAQLQPDQIGYIEAHGTGTKVGDPTEYQSIRDVLGGSRRLKPVSLGSVKGLIGHTEGASGGVSLVKSLLMLHHKAIPPQPSFQVLNPSIEASPTDKLNIASKLRAWDHAGELRAILINNYGASGSNASMLVSESPIKPTAHGMAAEHETQVNGRGTPGMVEIPFRFFGADDAALKRISARFRQFMSSGKQHVPGDKVPGRTSGSSLKDIAFNLSRQCNPTLERALAFTSRTAAELVDKLQAFENGRVESFKQPAPRPVILCFGGQVSAQVGLDVAVYRTAHVFRRHLNECDSVYRSLSACSMFPRILDETPVEDVVQLQVMLFSVQYACAMSWIDCGVRPTAIVGHSFGELTALCVSGMLDLHDTLGMIIARATIVREHWPGEKGSMMAVEADIEIVEHLLEEAGRRSEGSGSHSTIACVNGPRSFTLAGSSRSIDMVAQVIASNPTFSTIRSKRLKVTNAFHSRLVDPLVPLLHEVGRGLTFSPPAIPLEMATESRLSLDSIDAVPSFAYVADHMRNPVYFYHAVKRLSEQHPSAIWLEAGSNSTITGMASRALNAPVASHFQAVSITCTAGRGLQQLTNATINLWKQGLQHVHWSHHRSQTYDYVPLLLPPYQFEQTRHWMELKSPSELLTIPLQERSSGPVAAKAEPQSLWSFSNWKNDSQMQARFIINTGATSYQDLVAGHVIAKTVPICPATVELDIVIDALMSVRQGSGNLLPRIQGVRNQAAICHNPLRSVWLEVEAVDEKRQIWNWGFYSEARSSGALSPTVHATGQAVFASADDESERLDFSMYERMRTHKQCLDLLNNPDAAEDVMQGRGIYKTFSPVVDYGKPFQGLQRLVGRNNQSAGRLFKPTSGKTWFDAHLSDCFCQVGGIWVNCMTECDPKDIYIATGIEKWIRSPEALSRPQTEQWDVLANHHIVSNQTVLTDIFVFEPNSGSLTEVIRGINYHKVSKTSMSKMLLRLTTPASGAVPAVSSPVSLHEETSHASRKGEPLVESTTSASAGALKPGKSTAKVEEQIRALLADMSGLDANEIDNDAELAQIGIDSLMGMEVSRELGGLFKISLSIEDMIHVATFRDLVDFMKGKLGFTFDQADSSASLKNEENDISTSTSTEGSVHLPDDRDQNGYASTISEPSSIDEVWGVDANEKPTIDGELGIPLSIIQETFRECNRFTDKILADHGCTDYVKMVLPEKTKLCVCLAVEALEHMGCCLSKARPGEVLHRIECIPSQKQLLNFVYSVLEKEARLIETTDSVTRRTAAAVPTDSSKDVLNHLLQAYPTHICASKLTYFTGSRLAEVLRGDCDGIKLIFGSEEGRELVAALYGDFLLNQVANTQMQEILLKLVSKIPAFTGPLRIMELGAGTGGTTKKMVELLAGLNIPVKYTFTDLSGSFVAAARKRFKKHSFMDFRIHDIEKAVDQDLVGTQHIIIASNAIHATHSLVRSTENIRKALRPDGGILMMMEMMQPLHWVDMIFGLFEGWWLFDDGRAHAIAPETIWENALREAGYSHVYWTDGTTPEIKLERILLALTSPTRYESVPAPHDSLAGLKLAPTTDIRSREATIDEYVRKYTQGFHMPNRRPQAPSDERKICVALTGGTGSLGAHIVASLASSEKVDSIICLNRRSRTADAMSRQRQAFEKMGICIDEASIRKVRVFEADTKVTHLGLSRDDYQSLARSVTHIVHNAWPMTSKRPVSGLESQFQVMRNLIDLAVAASCLQGPGQGCRVTFQLVSSIATVGHYPIWSGRTLVPEEKMAIESVLPNGYGDAKFVCERMLDETLGLHPDTFRAMSVRPGQIAGSSVSGYWNPQEHLPFLIKSSQTLKALPDFDGDLCWTPVNQVAGTLCDLLLSPGATCPIYHIDNPTRQPWKDTIKVLAELLDVGTTIDVIPFDKWLAKVRSFSNKTGENPASQLVDFLSDNFVRMSCGGVVMDTTKACQHSPTLASVGPVPSDVVGKYLDCWRTMGFLH